MIAIQAATLPFFQIALVVYIALILNVKKMDCISHF